MAELTIAGSCVCRGVRYTIWPPFMAFQYCHCTRCRKASGSAHAANLFVPVDQLRWEAGQERVRRYDLPEAKYWSRCFCDVCGSSVPWKSRTGRAYIVPAGGLDGDPGMRPTRNIHFASRASWYQHASELPVFDAEAPKS